MIIFSIKDHFLLSPKSPWEFILRISFRFWNCFINKYNLYHSTAQHAIRQAKTVAKNIENRFQGTKIQKEFIYDVKGSMAKIGKNDGIALLLGHEFRRFVV